MTKTNTNTNTTHTHTHTHTQINLHTYISNEINVHKDVLPGNFAMTAVKALIDFSLADTVRFYLPFMHVHSIYTLKL